MTTTMNRDWFEIYADQYRAAAPEKRAESKAHWLRCYRRNLISRNKEMVSFAANFLAVISMVEAEETAA